VMVSTSRDPLLDDAAISSLRTRLISKAAIVTPNMTEAAMLTGLDVISVEDMEHAAEALLGLGAGAALVTGGHMQGDTLIDVLVTPQGKERFETPRIDTRHTHGTGCTLASAIACGLAQGMPIRDAVVRGREYVAEAIRTAPGFGSGHGPLNHAHTIKS